MKLGGLEQPVSTSDKPGVMQRHDRKWWILAVSAAGVLISTIDASIVNIALPTIGDYFSASVQATAWITIAYLLVITATLLIFGRLSDIYGQKLIFTSGLFIFTLGSGLCAISGTITQLIIFRVIQGIGAAMIVSNTSAIVTNAFPPEQRGKGLGVIGAVVSIGLMSGPPLGGMIIHYWGWNYIFLVNVPIGLIGIFLTLKILPEHKADKGAQIFSSLDSLLWIIGIIAMIAAFKESQGTVSFFLNLALFFTAGILLLWLFFVRQAKSNSPLFKADLLKNEIFLFASLAGFFSYMAMIGLSFMMPYLLQHTYAKSAFEAGKILVIIPAMTVFAAPISGHLSDKYGQRLIASLGALLSLTGISLMCLLKIDTAVWQILIYLILFGLGIGMFGSPNNSALMGSVDYKDRGSAGGVLATVRNLGMVTGLGIVSVIYNSGIKNTGAEALNYLISFHRSLIVVIVLASAALVFSALRRSVR
jgi:EmrB/QacA subfamily drug resistance transporter